MSIDDRVPEEAINYDAVLSRGGENYGDEDFAFFKCPSCGHVYLLEYEVDTVYLDGTDLSQRAGVFNQSFKCLSCEQELPLNEAWIGNKAPKAYHASWSDVTNSEWAWAVKETKGA